MAMTPVKITARKIAEKHALRRAMLKITANTVLRTHEPEWSQENGFEVCAIPNSGTLIREMVDAVERSVHSIVRTSYEQGGWYDWSSSTYSPPKSVVVIEIMM